MRLSARAKWYLIVMCIAFVFLLAGPLLFIASGRRALQQELDQWQAIGGKTSLSQLTPEPILEEENAAALYMEAYTDLKLIFTGKGAEWIDDSENDPDLAAHVAACSEVLQKIHEAARLERAVWAIDYQTQGADIYNVPLPHLGCMRHLSKLLKAEAIDHANRGEFDQAFQSIEAAHSLGAHVASDPFMIARLTSMAIRALAVLTFEEIYRDQELPPGAFQAGLFEEDFRAQVRQAILHEGAAFGDFLRDPEATDALGVYTGSVWYRFVSDRTTAEYLKIMGRAAENFSKPHWEQEIWEEDDSSTSGLAWVAGFVVPSLDGSNESTTKIDVRFTLARQAILLRRYRKDHGTYPDPATYETLTDPFSGQPLHYERTETGFLLWSEMENNKGQREEWDWN